MQLLHASFSSTLAFHCSTSPPKGRHVHVAGKSVVELITATSFSSQRYLRPACVSYSDPLCSSISPKAASSQALYNLTMLSNGRLLACTNTLETKVACIYLVNGGCIH